MSYEKFSEKLVEYIGGKSNMSDVYACMTRLRIEINNKSKVQIEKIESEKLVKRVQYKGNELQIVIGPEVNKIYNHFITLVDKDSLDQKSTEKNNQNLFSKFVGFLGGIFVPILPALIAGGMIKSITTLVEMAGWIDPTTDIGILLNILGDSVFYFLPFFLAISTARILKTNEYLATMVAAVILYPTLTNGLESGAATLNILGISIPVISYATTVFPIIFGVILLKYVFQFFERVVHENVRMIFSPLLTITIIGFLSLAFLAPIGHYLGEYLAGGITVIFDWNGVLASVIIGGFLPLIVMLGMHQSLFPLMLNNLAENGFDTLLPLFYLQTLAIAGAVFAVFFVTKNKDIKSSSVSTGITSFLGISEPALYGVTIPLKKPLIAALIGSGVAGGLSYFLGVRAFAFGLPSVLSIPTYINAAEGSSLSAVLISSLVSFGLAFVLSYILMRKEREPEAIMEEQTVDQTITTTPSSSSMNESENIYSPVNTGEVLKLSEVDDEVFSHQLLGPSVAIKPLNGDIYAPVNGKITMISETEHALGITSDNGLEILLHIGIDTVKLGGEPFIMNVKVGDNVQQGELIAEVDLAFLKDKEVDNVILLAVTNDSDIETIANEKVMEIFNGSAVQIVGMGIAEEVIPGMHKNLILHAGPPVEWERMCGPMKGAVIGALIYEGRAETEEEAIELIESGTIEFDPNHEHQTVGPMAGIISPSMPVFIIKNMTYGNLAYSNINEGAGKALRFGAYGEDVISRLHWIRESMYPILKDAIEMSGGIDIRTIVTQALQMGDDNHNRNKASTALFLRELAKYLVMIDQPKEEIYKVAEHLEKIDMFNVNLVMAMNKSISDAIMNAEIEGSTIVTVMARNGTDFGIKVSGTGNNWFTAPANIPEGLYFPGYSQEDAAPDIGDSAIAETYGLGGFSLAAAPAIVQVIGGTYQDGVDITNEMYEITTGESSFLKIPNLDFKGSPVGIDIIKVLKTGIQPTITTGTAHKDPGIGQVGAGIVKAPMECFEKAAKHMVENR